MNFGTYNMRHTGYWPLWVPETRIDKRENYDDVWLRFQQCNRLSIPFTPNPQNKSGTTLTDVSNTKNFRKGVVDNEYLM